MTLLFSRRFVPMILAGAKTQTRRLTRPSVKEGGTYRLRDGNKPTDRSITVTRVCTQRLGDISPEEAAAEGFSTLGEFREAWVSIYGSWVPEQTVYVVEFRLEGAYRNV
ncbi:MAG: ASCH domain-containing protein [Candidatus Bathyarchaeota archaeon]